MKGIFAAACLLLAGCQTAPPETLLQGETMGSVWSVKVAGALPLPAGLLQAGVQEQFEGVDQTLSTYRPTSDLSRFNANDSGEWVSIDAQLGAVLSYALSLAPRSDGAYDVTVGQLVNLWGFGPDPARNRLPDRAAIDAARAYVGWRKVEVDGSLIRARKQPGVRVDLSSLGKGRGVDRVADYLDSIGISNYLIDLSGKLRARGLNGGGRAWRVAVEQPGADNTTAPAPASIVLRDASVATAGDYRRYFEVDGRHFSHIIDPRTGAPVTHATVSATAMGETCMEADALATVLMVMEPDAALRLANEARIPALLIGRGSGYQLRQSAAWRPR
jgi:thiamine biosynthesis lipoprotein